MRSKTMRDRASDDFVHRTFAIDLPKAKGVAMEIRDIPLGDDGFIDPDGARKIIEILGGDKELFLYLDSRPSLGVDGWHHRLRQVRNRYTTNLFSSFRGTP